MAIQDTPSKKSASTLELTTRTTIADLAATASADERAQIFTLTEEAQRQPWGATTVRILTPPMSALLFLEHNPHNRDWRPEYALDLARQMRAGQWRRNNATIGFYRDGAVQDGQHRLSGKALAGQPFEALIAFGMERDAIVTTDVGSRRLAGAAAKLEGIAASTRKRSIVTMAAGYFVKAGLTHAALKSEMEILDKIRSANLQLDEALLIGAAAADKSKLVSPLLTQDQCETLAFLLLESGWENQAVRHHLAAFQLGLSKDGERTPFFVAAELLMEARKSREQAKHLSRTKELGIVIYALKLTEQGITAVQKKRFQDAVKKVLPDPKMPQADEAVA
jgi:hypothetical protein